MVLPNKKIKTCKKKKKGGSRFFTSCYKSRKKPCKIITPYFKDPKLLFKLREIWLENNQKIKKSEISGNVIFKGTRFLKVDKLKFGGESEVNSSFNGFPQFHTHSTKHLIDSKTGKIEKFPFDFFNPPSGADIAFACINGNTEYVVSEDGIFILIPNQQFLEVKKKNIQLFTELVKLLNQLVQMIKFLFSNEFYMDSIQDLDKKYKEYIENVNIFQHIDDLLQNKDYRDFNKNMYDRIKINQNIQVLQGKYLNPYTVKNLKKLSIDFKKLQEFGVKNIITIYFFHK